MFFFNEKAYKEWNIYCKGPLKNTSAPSRATYQYGLYRDLDLVLFFFVLLHTLIIHTL